MKIKQCILSKEVKANNGFVDFSLFSSDKNAICTGASVHHPLCLCASVSLAVGLRRSHWCGCVCVLGLLEPGISDKGPSLNLARAVL